MILLPWRPLCTGITGVYLALISVSFSLLGFLKDVFGPYDPVQCMILGRDPSCAVHNVLASEGALEKTVRR